MKKSIILLALVFAFSGAFAQKGKVTSAQNYKDTGKLDKAVEAISEAIDPNNPKSEKSINWPKSWEVRGDIYQAIGVSQDENFKKLSEDGLSEALLSYKKALELDEKDKYANGIKVKLTLLTNDLTNQAVAQFNEEDFKGALKSFEQILEIQEIGIIKADNPNAVDTVIIFNAGLAAYSSQDYDKAIKYHSMAAEHGYNGGTTYRYISDSYILLQDTASAIKAVQDGFEKYPEDNTVLTTMIDLYLKTGNYEDAMKYLEMAIKQDPSNKTYYFAQGTLYEQAGKEEKAIELYNKAIELDGEFFNAYYNLGALYYNKGVQQQQVAIDVPPNDNNKYQEELAKADLLFEKSLPYMEKCHELNPTDVSTLESLKNLYYRSKEMDKYNAILKKLGQ